MDNLKEKYIKEVVPALKEKFGYENNMAVPKMDKVVLNVGIPASKSEKAFMDLVADTLARISGQRAVFTKARDSISSFKVRQGMTVGSKVTLRGKRMYHFLDKLLNITFPNVRDFRGISDKQVDKRGNISIGFREHLPFPEISSEEVENVHGLEVCVNTTAKTKEEGLELFRLMGFPFKNH